MSSKICVNEILHREKNDRNNIFRDNDSEFFKNQSMVLSTHLRSHTNPKGQEEKRKLYKETL